MTPPPTSTPTPTPANWLPPGIPAGINACSIKKGMEIAGVGRRTIQNWITTGKISLYRTAGGAPRLDQAELLVLERPRKEIRNVAADR